MEFFVDDKPFAFDGRSDQPISDLTQQACRGQTQGEARIVVAMRCDGREIPQSEVDDILKKPASEFGRLDLHTQPIAALARATLAQAIAVLEDSTAMRERVADLLDEGRQEPAMAELQRLLEAWKQAQQTLLTTTQALRLPIDTLMVEGRSVIEVLEETKPMLTELRQAMSQGDHVLVGDLLRYEMEEPFQQWLALFRHLHDLATAQTA